MKIRPKYYKKCSDLGCKILSVAQFPFIGFTEKECIDVIEIMGLDFCLGNALKYIWRLGEKKSFLNLFGANKSDAFKALFYVERFIANFVENCPIEDLLEWVSNLKTVLFNYIHFGKIIL